MYLRLHQLRAVILAVGALIAGAPASWQSNHATVQRQFTVTGDAAVFDDGSKLSE